MARDVTLEDLESAHRGPWSDVLRAIREKWVDIHRSRAHMIRCGTMTVENVDGHARVTIDLRFPLACVDDDVSVVPERLPADFLDKEER